MSYESVAAQFFNVTPPLDAKVVNLAVTATAGNENLTTLDLDGAYDDSKRVDAVEVTFVADGCDVYVNFSATSIAIDPTTTGQATKVCFLLTQGMPASFRIDKKIQKVLNYVAASGKTGFLRFYASSHRSEEKV